MSVEGTQRFSLAVAPVQRTHKQFDDLGAQGMLGSQTLQRTDRLPGPTERQQDIKPLLETHQPELLETVRRTTDADVPVVAPRELDDTAPLDAPVEQEFRVGTMGLAWESDAARCVIEALAQVEGESEVEPLDDADEGPDALRVRLTAEMARAFIRRAQRVVAAGRPPCPLCNLPLDPEGHVCPRQNGHRR